MIKANATAPEFQKVQTVAAVTPAQAAAGARLLFVDNLRVFLTILVVLHHLSIGYGASGDWYYREGGSTELAHILLSLFTSLNHFYFMGLFFLIAGYFVPGAVDRKGGRQFVVDRLLRLGIPLVLFALLVNTIPAYLGARQAGWWRGDFTRFVSLYWRERGFSSGPLWFVEALLVFSLVYVLGRAILRRVRARQAKAALLPVREPLGHRHILAFILALAPLSFVVRLVFPIDAAWHNVQLGMFPQYIFLFAAGILAYRRGWLPDLPEGVRKTWSVVAVIAILILPLMMVLGGAIESADPFKGGLTWQALLTAAWEAVYCVSMAILLLAAFRLRFDRQGSLGRFLSRNAYTVYIIHAPVIVSLAYLLRDISLDPLLKFVLVAPLAVSLCFLTGHFLVRRIPLADKVL